MIKVLKIAIIFPLLFSTTTLASDISDVIALLEKLNGNVADLTKALNGLENLANDNIPEILDRYDNFYEFLMTWVPAYSEEGSEAIHLVNEIFNYLKDISPGALESLQDLSKTPLVLETTANTWLPSAYTCLYFLGGSFIASTTIYTLFKLYTYHKQKPRPPTGLRYPV